MKKISVWFLSLAMLLSLATPALAANEAFPTNAPAETHQTDVDKQAALTKLGGTPGKINVRLNDKCVAFPDAFPELKNGSTMVPVRAVVEALKAKVENPDAKTVKITLGDQVVTLTIGDVKVNVEKAGKTEAITLNAAPYIKDNRTYVPLRFISETFGYDVLWDQDVKTVVILDGKAIKAKLNERLSTLNLFLKGQSKYLEGNWKSEGSMDMSLEIVDSINGNKTYAIPGKMTSHMGGGAATVEASMDLSSLLPMFQKLATAADATDTNTLAMLKNVAKNQTISMKMLPDGNMYLKSGLYDMMFKELLGTGFDASKETWYKFPNMGADLYKAENYNVGSILYGSMMAQAKMLGAFSAYDQMMEAERQLTTFMDNDSFQKQGDTYVWSIDKAKILSMLSKEPAVAAEVGKVLQEANLKLSFTEAGTYSMSGTLKLDIQGLGSILSMSMDATGNTSGDDNANMQVQLRNIFNFGMKAKSKTTKVQEAPVVTMPKDAQIIDIMKMMNEFVAP